MHCQFKTEKLTGNGVITSNKTYSYDALNRLQSVIDSEDNHTVLYEYDENGNTIKKNDNALPLDYAESLFDYDALNRLVQIKKAGLIMGQYDYDDSNLRIRHRYSERGDVEYYHDGRSVIEERNAQDNSFMARYSYADKLLSMQTPNGSQYYHHDALGSTVNLTDQTGATQVSYFINPWGLILRQIGASENRKVFTGKELDERTGLVYFGARYYDPDTARFINQDSYLGETSTPPSLHRYLYAYSNPTVYIDLEGYESIREMGRLDEKSVEEDAAKDNSWGAAAKYAAKATGYKIWNGLTGGFLERQDNRQEKVDRGQISETDFWKGTGIDASVSVASQVVGGAVISKVTGRVVTATGSKFVGNVASGSVLSATTNLIEQSAQVITHEATDGRLGQERINFGEVVTSALTGGATAGVFHGVGVGVTNLNYNVKIQARTHSGWFEKVALAATKNSNSDQLVLGHYAYEGRSYQKVAAHYKATYFKVDNWNAVTKGLKQDDIWKINETFLMQQLRQGKQVLFSHDPLTAKPGSFFEREVRFMQELGYSFKKKNQWTWEAIR